MSDTVLSRVSRQSLLSEASLSSAQAQVDQLVGSFAEETFNLRGLAAMAVGSSFYRLGRIGTLAMVSHAPRMAPLLNLASYGVGLACEVTGFLGANDLTQAPSYRARGTYFERWRTSFVQFGFLKFGAAAGGGQNLLTRHLFQDTSMVVGHQLTARWGWTPDPQGNIAQQFLHAEALNLQMTAGMGLVYHAAPTLPAWERGLDLALRSQLHSPHLPSSFFGRPGAFAAAEETGRAEIRLPSEAFSNRATPSWTEAWMSQLSEGGGRKPESRDFVAELYCLLREHYLIALNLRDVPGTDPIFPEREMRKQGIQERVITLLADLEAQQRKGEVDFSFLGEILRHESFPVTLLWEISRLHPSPQIRHMASEIMSRVEEGDDFSGYKPLTAHSALVYSTPETRYGNPSLRLNLRLTLSSMEQARERFGAMVDTLRVMKEDIRAHQILLTVPKISGKDYHAYAYGIAQEVTRTLEQHPHFPDFSELRYVTLIFQNNDRESLDYFHFVPVSPTGNNFRLIRSDNYSRP